MYEVISFLKTSVKIAFISIDGSWLHYVIGIKHTVLPLLVPDVKALLSLPTV